MCGNVTAKKRSHENQARQKKKRKHTHTRTAIHKMLKVFDMEERKKASHQISFFFITIIILP